MPGKLLQQLHSLLLTIPTKFALSWKHTSSRGWYGPAAGLKIGCTGCLQDAKWMYKTYCYGTHDSTAEQLGCCCQKADPSQGVITLRLSQNMFEGSTGCHDWEAGFFLAEYILNHSNLVKGAYLLCQCAA